MNDTSTGSLPDRAPKRVRHELRFRSLEVARVTPLASGMIRVTLKGEDLQGFTSLGFDDHIKMFFPRPGQSTPTLPVSGPNGPEFPEGAEPPIARDYTPRRHDPVAGELDIDFALHDHGPASDWARNVKPGDGAWLGGPRGSFVMSTAFDWLLLVGDATALPAIARRLEELPAGTRVVAVIEVDDGDNELPPETKADARIVWVHRDARPAGDLAGLMEALQALDWPAGDYHAWISCESQAAKAIRAYLIAERGANPKWMRASGYWRRGTAGVHDHFDD